MEMQRRMERGTVEEQMKPVRSQSYLQKSS